jgi:hypothetical protein
MKIRETYRQAVGELKTRAHKVMEGKSHVANYVLAAAAAATVGISLAAEYNPAFKARVNELFGVPPQRPDDDDCTGWWRICHFLPKPEQ